MKIKILDKVLFVEDCYPYRYPNGKLVLRFKVFQDQISHDDLKSILKTNTKEIIKIDDEGKEEVYNGFTFTFTILDIEDVYECEVECTSEVNRKVGDMELKLKEYEDIISTQQALLNQQNEALDIILTDIIPKLSKEREEV